MQHRLARFPGERSPPRFAINADELATCCLMQRAVHRNNLSENWLHSSDPKTRRKVSCEGMPPGRGRNLLSHSLRVSPNNSMSGQSSAPHNTARIAMAIMSSNRWSQRPTTRGSSRSLKHAFKPPKKSRVASSMIEPSLALDRGGAGSPPDYARPSCVTYSQVALYVQLLMRQPCRCASLADWPTQLLFRIASSCKNRVQSLSVDCQSFRRLRPKRHQHVRPWCRDKAGTPWST